MQSPHGFPVAAKHGDSKRRAALGILRLEIRAKLDQEFERAIVFAGAKQPAHESVGRRDHVVEGCLLLLEFRETPRDRLRVARNHTAQ